MKKINYGFIDKDVYIKKINFNKAVIWKFRELSIHTKVVEDWFQKFPVTLLRFIDEEHNIIYEIPYDTAKKIWEKKKVGQEEQYYFSISYLKKGGIMADDWEKVEQETGDTWDFEGTPEIQGILVNKEEHVGPNDSMMYRLEIESDTEGTKEIGVWGNVVLDGRFKKIEVGEEVKLVYLGKQKSPKTNREYHAFDVFHRAAPMKKIN